jgi:hypothetical protein
VGTLGAFVLDDRVQRFEPFLGFGGVDVLIGMVGRVHAELHDAAQGSLNWDAPSPR